jgi:hypothetical protein
MKSPRRRLAGHTSWEPDRRHRLDHGDRTEEYRFARLEDIIVPRGAGCPKPLRTRIVPIGCRSSAQADGSARLARHGDGSGGGVSDRRSSRQQFLRVPSIREWFDGGILLRRLRPIPTAELAEIAEKTLRTPAKARHEGPSPESFSSSPRSTPRSLRCDRFDDGILAQRLSGPDHRCDGVGRIRRWMRHATHPYGPRSPSQPSTDRERGEETVDEAVCEGDSEMGFSSDCEVGVLPSPVADFAGSGGGLAPSRPGHNQAVRDADSPGKQQDST